MSASGSPTTSDHPPRDGTHAATVAWLRLVEEEDGSGLRAALFQTSGDGEPMRFGFTRWRRSPSGGPGVAVQAGVLASLEGSLFPSVASRPALILGLVDEMPDELLRDGSRMSVPLCRIGVADPEAETAPAERDPGSSRFDVVWAEQPDPDSVARRILAGLLNLRDPLEPFDRAALCLRAAFRDEHVRALTAGLGLTAVVTLASPIVDAGDPAGPAAVRGSADDPPEDPVRGDGSLPEHPCRTLAECLWAVLAARRPGAGSRRLAWPAGLMPFQQDGIGALLESRQLLLADDMGLGKTVQAIGAVRILWARGEIGSALVAAPASLLDQWRSEIARWAPDLSAIIVRGSEGDRRWQWASRAVITLVSYDTLRSDFRGRAQSNLRGKVWDVVIADEAQRIKNRNATSDALKGLPRVRSWALTGTPIENREEELASIMEFVDYDGPGTRRHYRPGWELSGRHRELQLRRKKDEVLDDLPPKQVTRIAISLDSTQRSSYDKAERDGIVYLRSLGAEARVGHILELITRLKQICNADPKTGQSTKLADISDRLGRLVAQGHKALVFSQYTSDTAGVAAAARHLKDFSPLVISGAIPQEERVRIIERFKTRPEHKALILSLRAGGLGLNLQDASYVFHLDRWWNPAVERQAEDRSHRMGQTVKVNVFKYSCIATIEERIDQILERKQGIFDELVDDVSLDLSTRLSAEELFGLFGITEQYARR